MFSSNTVVSKYVKRYLGLCSGKETGPGMLSNLGLARSTLVTDFNTRYHTIAKQGPNLINLLNWGNLRTVNYRDKQQETPRWRNQITFKKYSIVHISLLMPFKRKC